VRVSVARLTYFLNGKPAFTRPVRAPAELISLLFESGVDFRASTGGGPGILPSLLFPLLWLTGMNQVIKKQFTGATGSVATRAKKQAEATTFEDVAGVDVAKGEVRRAGLFPNCCLEPRLEEGVESLACKATLIERRLPPSLSQLWGPACEIYYWLAKRRARTHACAHARTRSCFLSFAHARVPHFRDRPTGACETSYPVSEFAARTHACAHARTRSCFL
jgi:hypothetical protein